MPDPTYSQTEWPYDPTAAKTIECYVTKAPRAKLYVWREFGSALWQYTMSAGPNNERSHTGCMPQVLSIDPGPAVVAAIAACKKNRSWEV